MNDNDFLFCKFVYKEMRFLTYLDFCANCDMIWYKFTKLTKNQKLFYRWYVYANIHCNETYKNHIWDFLNGYINKGELFYYSRFYRSK